jgi:hypothetical protein
MLAKSGTVLLAAAVLSLLGVPRALAEKDYELLEPYGGPTQTWQDIEKARRDIQRRIEREYHYGSGAYGTYRPPAALSGKRHLHQARHESHERQAGAQ